MRRFLFAFIIIMALLMPSTSPAVAANPSQIPAEMYSPNVAQAWMDLLYKRVSVIGIYPPTAARVYGYASVALYEATAVGTPKINSLSGRLNDMPAMPQPNPDKTYDWPTVVNGAVATASEPILNESPVKTLFNSTQREQVRSHVKRLRDQIESERLAIVDKDVVDRSMQLGTEIGQAIEAWAATDGFAETRTMTYEVPTGDPSLWVTIPSHAEPIEPHWHLLRPLALVDPLECQVPLAVEFSTDIHSDFYHQAMEVYHLSVKATQEEEEIADFWDDQAGEAGMHPGHWMLIANQLVDQQNLDLAQAAQMFMLAGVAVHDAGIAAWAQKYNEMVIRPETYIQRYIDPTWEPFLDTPNFPEYPSGHATFGAATAEVLTNIWGIMALTDNGGVVDDMGRSRTFTSLEAAAYENGLSRLYGGIHYRIGMEAGLRSGECVGQRILHRLGSQSQRQLQNLPSQNEYPFLAQPNTSQLQSRNQTRLLEELAIPRQWIELVHQQVDQQGFDLPTTARIIAYMTIALDQAIRSEEGQQAFIYPGLEKVPTTSMRNSEQTYDNPTVAIGALATVAGGLLTGDYGGSVSIPDNHLVQNAVFGIRNLQVRKRLQVVDRATADASLAYGSEIGQQILDWAASDGFADFASHPFIVPIGHDAYWQTTSHGVPPEQPNWHSLRPLILGSPSNGSQGEALSSCTQPLALEFSTFPGKTFHMQMNEVYQAVKNVTLEQSDIAQFWGHGSPLGQREGADGGAARGNSVTRWMLIAAQVSEEKRLNLAQASKLYASIGAAIHDSLIQIWGSKYEVFLLRPQTYINNFIDEGWQPYLPTPNSPGYPSGSAATGAAAAEILAAYFGTTHFADTMGVIDGESTLHRFTTFEAAAYEAGMAELYAGTSMRSAIEAGLQQGECVGQAIWETMSWGKRLSIGQNVEPRGNVP
ncbi:MAG: hypothetical protein AAF702_23770 [Chloroflexota bacterium]